LLTKIDKLETENKVLAKKLKITEYSNVETYEELKQKNEKLALLEKELTDARKKLETIESVNRKLRIAISNAKSNIKNSHKNSENNKAEPLVHSEKTKRLFQIATKELGKQYVWGAVGPKTFDCSGFTSYVYKKVGINIPRTSKQQARYGKLIKRDQLKPGDLIFFDTDYHKKGIDHVGIYIGNDKFIHASSAKKRVIITSLNKAFYKQRFMLARRVN